MSQIYHPGELEVQARAGAVAAAARMGRSIRSSLPGVAREFLARQPLILVGSVGADQRVWASVLIGPPGFVTAVDEHTVRIAAQPLSGDPLETNLGVPGKVALLAIEFAPRRRMRVNGLAEWRGDALNVRVEQAYANCPKYIQARSPAYSESLSAEKPTMRSLNALAPDQQRWIAQADTFFIASFHANGGADISHRGGNPGFIRVLDAERILWPDYAGNQMFQTLGNLALNPQTGLLFLDFEAGTVAQLTGRARIVWDPVKVASFPGAERLVEFQLEQMLEHTNALPFRWRFLGYSPFNFPTDGSDPSGSSTI